MFANHGRLDKYGHEIEGVNSRLDGLQAAILRVKLRYLDSWTEARRELAYYYNDLFCDTPVKIPVEIDNVRAVYHLYVVRLENGVWDAVRKKLAKLGIATGIHYPIALPNLEAYSYLSKEERDCPKATKAAQEILSLPLYPELGKLKARYIADTLLDTYSKIETTISAF